MKPTCVVVRLLAPSADVSVLSGRLAAHVGGCLSCQAEIARYGKIRRELTSLAAVVVPAPASLAAAVGQAIASIDEPAEPSSALSHPARVAAAVGTVAAAAAGAVAVAVWRHPKAPA
jgi:anti-sigma factor RsiW